MEKQRDKGSWEDVAKENGGLGTVGKGVRVELKAPWILSSFIGGSNQLHQAHPQIRP